MRGEKGRRSGGGLKRWGTLLFLLILLAVAVRLYRTYISVEIGSNSMAPTLVRGDKVLVNVMAYRKRPPQRGDIVYMRDPVRKEETEVKRVVGLPGEWVAIVGGRVYIRRGRSGWTPLDEPYVKNNIVERPMRWFVPEGHIFVLGDNRERSEDSRDWGPVPLDLVIGRVVYRYSPWSRHGPVR